MEVLMRNSVEQILLLTCCLIIAPTITTSIDELGQNSDNTDRVSRFHYLGEDSSNGDTWNDNYPLFSNLLQQKIQGAKRRSSFFPVRGKKDDQNVYVPKSETPTGYSVIAPESTNTDRRTFLPALRGASHSFYDVSDNGRGYVRRFLKEPLQAVENASGALDLMESLDFTQPQKRPSSFMPMRGRKQYTSGSHLQLLKRYLASRQNSLGLAYGNDETTVPTYSDKAKKEDKDFLDQMEKHFKFDKDDLRSLTLEETDNGGIMPEPKSLSSGKVIPEKRALSFVPTRGRRAKSGEPVPEFPQYGSAPQSISGWPEDFAAGRMAINVPRYSFEADGENQQRYRRASAFLPMRGRKSSESSQWLAYNILPRYVSQMRRSGELAGHDGIENSGKYPPKIQGLMFAADTRYTGGRRQKKSYSRDEGLQSSISQQKLRTALVMKRPSSFFAARGKRLTDDDINKFLGV